MTAHQVRCDGASVSTNDGARSPGTHYEIRVAGRLGLHWSAWFEGLSIAPGPNGTTVLSGPVGDQAALHGLLQKLRDLGVPLLELTAVPSDDEPPGPTPKEH
mgnify:FL=1